MERLTKPLIVPDTGEVLAYMRKVGITDEKIRTKLGGYEDLEEQGLLLRLPCKVGDTVYALTPFCEICEEYLGNECACECCCRGNFVTETKFDYEMIRMFGKTVFPTKEEAEAALEKLKGEEHE